MCALPTINNAQQFSAISDEAFPDTFIFNIKNFFNYQTNDIPKIFKNRRVTPIKTLRNELITRVATDYSEYAGSVPLTRTNKSEHIKDILILGNALARPENVNELKKHLYL